MFPEYFQLKLGADDFTFEYFMLYFKTNHELFTLDCIHPDIDCKTYKNTL